MSFYRPPQDVNSLFSIKIDNVAHETRKEDLEKVYEKFGRIGDIHIPRDHQTGDGRGFAFVRFFELKDAEAAARETNGTTLDGKQLIVDISRQPRRTEYDFPNRSHSRSRGHGRSRSRSRSSSRSSSRGHSRRHRSSSESSPSRSRSRGHRHHSSRSRRDRSRSKSR